MQIERVRCQGGIQAGVLNAGEDENSPENIDLLRRDPQHPKRGLGGNGFGDEAGAVVSDEHNLRKSKHNGVCSILIEADTRSVALFSKTNHP